MRSSRIDNRDTIPSADRISHSTRQKHESKNTQKIMQHVNWPKLKFSAKSARRL